jgi:hypothetical protein
MAERRNSEPALDEAIDRTVREMMNADARLGFERRVMQRLTQQPVPSVVLWPRLAGAAAIIATHLVAALFLRGAREPQTVPRQPDVAVAQSPDTPAVTPSVPTVTPQPPSTEATGRITQRAPRPTRGDGVVIATGTEPAIASEPPIATIAALDPPPALAVENIEQRPVNVAAIRMPAIDIPRLDVEALGPRDERSRE